MALPVVRVTRPADLAGCKNGIITPGVHVPVSLPGSSSYMHHAAAEALMVMAANMRAETGFELSSIGMFRPFPVQEAGFFRSYRTPFDPAKCVLDHQRAYKGVRYYLLKRTTPKATPGTSDHGDGLSVDVAIWRGRLIGRVNIRNLTVRKAWDWLVRRAPDHGFSWAYTKLGVDDPHLQYFAGDQVPPAVAAARAGLTLPAGQTATTGTYLPVLFRTNNRPDDSAMVAAVKRVQRWAGVADDGWFGPRTEQAVIAKQKANHLEVDGIVGRDTWAVIVKAGF